MLSRTRTSVLTPPLARTALVSPRSVPSSNAPVFEDDFTGTQLDTTKWIALSREGDVGNSEAQYYSPAQVSVSGSNLVLTTATCASTPASSLVGTGGSGGTFNTIHTANYSYVSGMVQSATFNFAYGTIEYRAQFANGAGMWPAVWLLGASFQGINPLTADNFGPAQWPVDALSSGEVDLTEIKTGSSTTTAFQNILGGTTPLTLSINDTHQATVDVTQWHTYRMIWTPGQMQWLIDGAVIFTDSTAANIPTHPMMLLINNAVGGGGGGAISAAFPQTTLIDYIRVWSL